MLLDGLLSLPHILVGIRNWLLPVPPPPLLRALPESVQPPAAASVVPSESTSLAANASSASPRPSTSQTDASVPEHTAPLSDPENISGHETGSDADVESNNGDGDGSGVESSWVSLGSRGSE